MKESEVEDIVKDYVIKSYPVEEGWIIPEIHRHIKSKGEHGIDISLYNQRDL